MGEIYLRVLFSRAGLPAASFNMLSIRVDSVFTPQKADMLIKVCSNSVPPGGGGGGGSAQKLPFGGGGGPMGGFSDLPPEMLRLIVQQVFEGDVTSTRLARVSQDALSVVNEVKNTIQFAWWSGESAALVPMAFPGDPEVVKAQLINDVHVMNQQHLTRTFSQVRGCDKEDILRIVKNEWLTNFALRMIVDVMGHYNAYTDTPAVAWPTGYALLPENLSSTLALNPTSLNLVHSQPSTWNLHVRQQVSSA